MLGRVLRESLINCFRNVLFKYALFVIILSAFKTAKASTVKIEQKSGILRITLASFFTVFLLDTFSGTN